MDKSNIETVFNAVCTTKNYKFTYGTAGFRDTASKLDTVMFTTGILAALRSIYQKGKYTGVMITASHNPPIDNGVKIVEPNGDMLAENWENIITNLVNLAANDSFENWFNEMSKFNNTILMENQSTKPCIMVAHDSRESSPHLLQCLLKGAQCWFGEENIKIINHGLLTTPQLHYLTSLQDPKAGVDDYNAFFQKSWEILFKQKVNNTSTNNNPLPFNNLFIDTANGVGGVQLESFLKNWLIDHKRIHIVNNDYKTPSKLNVKCGADFVKTNHLLPSGIENIHDPKNLYCSYDGDADRIVFYFIDNDKKFHLLDGDKISTLFAKFLSNLLKETHLDQSLKIGVVQTAYANGNSTNYITDKLRIPVSCTKTGVKHLHHEAKKSYDIGIYFEANGHGTIIFSDKFFSLVKPTDPNQKIQTLYHFSNIINQTVGDAISDMLGVLITLSLLDLSPNDWDNEYSDLPNLLTKLVVPDRTIFKTTDQERKLTSPDNLQPLIDQAVAKFPNGRSFVRASGTEDAVRIYCEANTLDNVKSLSTEVTESVLKCVT